MGKQRQNKKKKTKRSANTRDVKKEKQQYDLLEEKLRNTERHHLILIFQKLETTKNEKDMVYVHTLWHKVVENDPTLRKNYWREKEGKCNYLKLQRHFDKAICIQESRRPTDSDKIKLRPGLFKDGFLGTELDGTELDGTELDVSTDTTGTITGITAGSHTRQHATDMTGQDVPCTVTGGGGPMTRAQRHAIGGLNVVVEDQNDDDIKDEEERVGGEEDVEEGQEVEGHNEDQEEHNEKEEWLDDEEEEDFDGDEETHDGSGNENPEDESGHEDHESIGSNNRNHEHSHDSNNNENQEERDDLPLDDGSLLREGIINMWKNEKMEDDTKVWVFTGQVIRDGQEEEETMEVTVSLSKCIRPKISVGGSVWVPSDERKTISFPKSFDVLNHCTLEVGKEMELKFKSIDELQAFYFGYLKICPVEIQEKGLRNYIFEFFLHDEYSDPPSEDVKRLCDAAILLLDADPGKMSEFLQHLNTAKYFIDDWHNIKRKLFRVCYWKMLHDQNRNRIKMDGGSLFLFEAIKNETENG